MLTKDEGVKSRGEVVLALHPEPKRKHQLHQGGCRDGRCAQPHVLCGRVKVPLQHQELLVLRGLCEGLPDGVEVFGVGHMDQVQQVREVRSEVLFRTLVILIVPDPLVL